jgi:hypothetical protein
MNKAKPDTVDEWADLLGKLAVPAQELGEITAGQAAKLYGRSSKAAHILLTELVEAKKMTRRWVRGANGRGCWAYRKAK